MTVHDSIAQIEALMPLTSSDPWEAEGCDVYAKNHSVCECMSPGNSPYYGEPEARLIADMRNAMPSLIAYIRALERVRDETDLLPWDLRSSDLEQALAAAREAGK